MELKRNDAVEVRRLGDSCDWALAEVAVISSNGGAIGLLLHPGHFVHAYGGMIAGMLPLTYKDGRYLGLMDEEYQIRTGT